MVVYEHGNDDLNDSAAINGLVFEELSQGEINMSGRHTVRESFEESRNKELSLMEFQTGPREI